MKPALLAAACALLAGCPDGNRGTLDVAIVTTPGSTVLATANRLRVTLTAPRLVVEAMRGDDGFALALEVDATGDLGQLVVEAFQGDTLVASGITPPFVVNGGDAQVAVFIAPPLSVSAAPADVPAGLADAAAAALPYGAIAVGGTAIGVYNAYDHTLLPGVPLLAARTGPTIGARSDGIVYLFGGLDANAMPTGTFELFDTRVAPAGAHVMLGEIPELARADARAVLMDRDSFLVTGDPAIEIMDRTAVGRPDLGALGPAGASVPAARGRVGVFAGPGGIVRVAAETAAMLDPTPRPAADVVALGTTGLAVIDGATREVIVVDANTDVLTVHAGALAHTFMRPVAAATDRFVVVAGGGDHASVDVLDLTTLQTIASPTATAPDVPYAIALPNGQVLLGGAPLQLFTPPPPVLVATERPAAARTSETAGRDAPPPRVPVHVHASAPPRTRPP